ncbi:hypothetical protein SFR_2567 [Streptomyces sp. FR-008]|nr:hypothetical protein SFR_2567 [Streptomyces sp. FR-008]
MPACPDRHRGTCAAHHQLLALQELQRLLNRGVRRVEALLQLCGRGQCRRGREVTAQDLRPQVRRDPLVQRTRVHAAFLTARHGHPP